jgi:site-specific DNA recombinase
MPDPIVDIYCRVASADSSGTFLDKQEAACRAYCLQHSLLIGTIFREVASSTDYRQRDGLTKLRGRYKTGQIQGVVMTTLDRLSRSQVNLVILLSEMDQYNIRLYLVKESMDESPLGRLTLLLQSFAAELDRIRALNGDPTTSSQS